MKRIRRALGWLQDLFGLRTASNMIIVRRYADANGSYVGELYLYDATFGRPGYTMMGVSLDTLPLDTQVVVPFELDTEHDFLAPMPKGYVRVGSWYPEENDRTRQRIRELDEKGPIVLRIENRFVEYVLSGQGDKRC